MCVRLKPPAPKAKMGWRVEFRPLEVKRSVVNEVISKKVLCLQLVKLVGTFDFKCCNIIMQKSNILLTCFDCNKSLLA